MANHCFMSYSTADGLEFARKLANKLKGGTPEISVWFDKDDLKPSTDWDIQIDHALKTCRMVLFIMTKDSTHERSVCRQEWSRALSFKKPIVPLWVHNDIDVPFRLQDRQRVDFRGEFDRGLAQLRDYLAWLDSPEGILQGYKDRLLDAERDLQRVKDDDKPRVEKEIEELNALIQSQQKIVDNPKAAQEQTQKNIESGLERERKPERPTAAQTSTKFINPPPGIAPNYFQNRYLETKGIVDFLNNDSQRLITIIGRGGVGKTTMVCRLLKGLENGELPDGLSAMKVDGIVYLSESGSHRVNFANIFYDLCKLLPAETAGTLDTIYKSPQASTEIKMGALLEKFSIGRVVLLLDNFESQVDTETLAIRDVELDEALRAFLNGAHTTVNIIITTRIPPRPLNLLQPGRQRVLILDEGLDSPYAEKILREMDSDGYIGLRSASDDMLTRARERTRGYPRALEALFAILASDRYTTLEELLAMPTPENVVEALVGEAFNRLDTNAQKAMQALAVYNRPVTPAAVDYLLAPYLRAIDSASILQRLANMHFARKESGRFYLHHVDREFAFGLIAEGKKKEERDNPDELRFTQYDLLERAADYFAQARKPGAECKTLEDLSAQLAEFDLRYAAGDYNAAARVLREIDSKYLLLWGHYNVMIDLHLRIKNKITDTLLIVGNLNGLGLTHRHIGKVKESIAFFEQGLKIAREANNRSWEGAFLGNIGGTYHILGDVPKAIEFYEQALAISREIGAQVGEGSRLGNLGSAYADLGNARKAIEFYELSLNLIRQTGKLRPASINLENTGYAFLSLKDYQQAKENFQQAIQIADEISYRTGQQSARLGLAQAHLFQEELVQAHAVIKSALQYDVPDNNCRTATVHGIIALRLGDVSAAREAFTHAISQAAAILMRTAEFYEALDAKALALCGLAICDSEQDISAAMETFRQARKIAPHAGVVKRVLRLFDELDKCDEERILKDVRKAVEGTE